MEWPKKGVDLGLAIIATSANKTKNFFVRIGNTHTLRKGESAFVAFGKIL